RARWCRGVRDRVGAGAFAAARPCAPLGGRGGAGGRTERGSSRGSRGVSLEAGPATATGERRFDVTTFGQALVRLSVADGQRLETAGSFAVHVAGAEINVAAALAGLGRRVAWGGGLPDGRLGERVLRHLRSFGIASDCVVTLPDARLGTYYVELASAPRRTDVIYDRAGSAAARVRHHDVPWEPLLDTAVLHLTGITPALSADAAAVVAEAVHRAKAAGVKVSFDVNYR